MKRRSIVTAVVAGAAVAAGIGWSLRERYGLLGRGDRGGDDIDRLLWTQRFEQPDGGRLVMAERRGKPLLLNLWASWCAPCVREMPVLDRFQREHRNGGWQVVGLAIDALEPVRRFLAAVPVDFPIGLAGISGIELAHSLGNAGGQLPFSVVFDAKGAIRARKLGVVEPAALSRWVAEIG